VEISVVVVFARLGFYVIREREWRYFPHVPGLDKQG